jgi:hypothetical protein
MRLLIIYRFSLLFHQSVDCDCDCDAINSVKANAEAKALDNPQSQHFCVQISTQRTQSNTGTSAWSELTLPMISPVWASNSRRQLMQVDSSSELASASRAYFSIYNPRGSSWNNGKATLSNLLVSTWWYKKHLMAGIRSAVVAREFRVLPDSARETDVTL